MGARAAWALVVPLALAITLIGYSRTSEPPRPGNPRAAIQTLLTRYADAVRSGDESRLRALVAPDRADFLRDQLRLLHNLSGVSTTTFEYRLNTEVPADPIAQQQQWQLDSVVSYALAGVDTVPVRRPITIGVRRDGTGWLVCDATPAAVPWEFGPVIEDRPAVPDRAAVVLGHPGSALVPRLAEQIGSALQSLESFWGEGFTAGVLMLAAGSDAEFRALVGDSRMDGVAAAAAADGVVDGVAVGQRLVFAPGSAALRPDQLRVVLRHELFHAATRTVTSDRAPLWLVEGAADYNGRRGGDVSLPTAAPTLTAQIRRGLLPDHLPTDIDLVGDHRTEAYEEAWSVAQFIADTFGEPALKRLYLDAAGAAAPPVGEAIGRTLGVDEDRLVQMWRRWLSGRPIR